MIFGQCKKQHFHAVSCSGHYSYLVKENYYVSPLKPPLLRRITKKITMEHQYLIPKCTVKYLS